MVRSSITSRAVLALASALSIPSVAMPSGPGKGRTSTGGKRQRVIPTTERDATGKRERKNAPRLKQVFYDHKATNHPGREFIGCDERRAELAERKAMLHEHGATAARLRHNPLASAGRAAHAAGKGRVK